MSTPSVTISDLAGKAVLITGASTGIGAALARAFAAQGASVGLHYNSSVDAAERLAGDISDSGGKVVLVKGDASRSGEMARVVEETAAAFGQLNGLINNAGGMVARLAYQEMTDNHYDAVMDLNARSVLSASTAAIPHLKAQGGFIINTTSIAARNGAGNGAGLYGSSKAFVSNVTRGMAKELIPFGIRVNAVAPGVIDTPFHERYSTQAQLDAMLATIPQGRLGTAEDCVGAYLFLASAALSGYLIGQTIEVNGGQLMP
ncbi:MULTISPECIES: SDR family oxidoreductase [unclassified Phyllobacterium]|uniref:SDR family NAD(P)-dependent oxidoreductase n=1 Tax=Phyllobacterium TaxID=28100 RepID=UPI000DD6D246|nr:MULTISPECIES: SDR family oxidoreductase [unclassified Phyllobacterium]MBA8899564.1 3-oxoacyl-[acyl-carrier protein] reductase [Phyllobacterium sp. P30BS-XVII]UGX85575.1 SDR family oxidoreductase [Phyllobacterium sp. T1293]